MPKLPKPTPTADTLNEFWAEVEKIGWKNKPDSQKAKVALLRDWSPNKTDRMNEAYSFLHDALYDKCFKVVDGLGDDGFGDLIAHIIGLGKEEYEKNMADPALADTRARKGTFRECFGYCLPSPEDYSRICVEHYAHWAERTQEELKAYKSQNAIDLIRFLDCVLNFRVPEFLKNEEKIRSTAEALAKESPFNKWAIWNLCSDLRLYFPSAG